MDGAQHGREPEVPEGMSRLDGTIAGVPLELLRVGYQGVEDILRDCSTGDVPVNRDLRDRLLQLR